MIGIGLTYNQTTREDFREVNIAWYSAALAVLVIVDLSASKGANSFGVIWPCKSLLSCFLYTYTYTLE